MYATHELSESRGYCRVSLSKSSATRLTRISLAQSFAHCSHAVGGGCSPAVGEGGGEGSGHGGDTMYNLRHAQDMLNPRTHADFMMLSHEDKEEPKNKFPYWFGRIVGIFHAAVIYTGPGSHSVKPQHMVFLFVRWFGCNLGYQGGWNTKQPHQVGFIDRDDKAAFGFLDLQEVIQGVHLIPAFHYGRTHDLLPPSHFACPRQDNDKDWEFFYVNQ